MAEENNSAYEIDQYVEKGLAALEREQYDAAAEIFRRAVQRAPFRHDVRDYLAFALDRQFSREGIQPEARLPGQVGSSSSAAAVASGRPRATRVRFPLRTMIAAMTAAALVLAVIVVARSVNLSGLREKIAKPRASAGAKQITDALARADNAVGRGQWDEALQILQSARGQVAASDPSNAAAVESQIAEVYAARARSFFDKHNYDKAFEVAQEGLKRNPNSPPLNLIVGQYYEREGNTVRVRDKAQARALWEKACEALSKTIAADPRNLEALDLLGKTYSRFDDLTKAINTWKRIVELAPDSSQAEKARNYLKTYRATP
ncbi:tetratricopeptide repeat protein [Candidatus Sumerlaeota bacterium]|nr:tetratricopeptide repeat protein [Candidatus Sumerlaeota bacterium]